MSDLSQCDAGRHSLIDIASYGKSEEAETVRWCTVCGSVVVDIDYDGRTHPGAVMPMRVPLAIRERPLTPSANPATL